MLFSEGWSLCQAGRRGTERGHLSSVRMVLRRRDPLSRRAHSAAAVITHHPWSVCECVSSVWLHSYQSQQTLKEAGPRVSPRNFWSVCPTLCWLVGMEGGRPVKDGQGRRRSRPLGRQRCEIHIIPVLQTYKHWEMFLSPIAWFLAFESRQFFPVSGSLFFIPDYMARLITLKYSIELQEAAYLDFSKQ